MKKAYSGCRDSSDPHCDVIIPVYGSSENNHSRTTRVKFHGSDPSNLNTRIYLDYYSNFIIYDENIGDKHRFIKIMEGQQVHTISISDLSPTGDDTGFDTGFDLPTQINNILNEDPNNQLKQSYIENEGREDEIIHGDYFIYENIEYSDFNKDGSSFSTEFSVKIQPKNIFNLVKAGDIDIFTYNELDENYIINYIDDNNYNKDFWIKLGFKVSDPQIGDTLGMESQLTYYRDDDDNINFIILEGNDDFWKKFAKENSLTELEFNKIGVKKTFSTDYFTLDEFKGKFVIKTLNDSITTQDWTSLDEGISIGDTFTTNHLEVISVNTLGSAYKILTTEASVRFNILEKIRI